MKGTLFALSAATLFLVACSQVSTTFTTIPTDQQQTPASVPEATPAVTPESSSATVAAACQDAFKTAAFVPPMQDTVEDLYPAVRSCQSLDEWAAANAANPAALDGADPFEFLGNVCDYGAGLSSTDLCGALLAACGQKPYADTTYCLTR